MISKDINIQLVAGKGGSRLHLPSHSRLCRKKTQFKTHLNQAAVFLDRDGVLVKDVHFLKNPNQIDVISGVVPALRVLQQWFLIVVATNQSGIARGLFTESDLGDIHLDLVRKLADLGVVIDAIYYCPHLPEATVPDYRSDCECRKPKPGMLLQAARDWNIDPALSFMVGDAPRDLEAGRKAGMRSIAVGVKKAWSMDAIEVVSNLQEASQTIMGQQDVIRRIAAQQERR